MAHLLSVIADGVFIYRNVSDYFEENLFSLFHTITSLNLFFQSIETVDLRRDITENFQGLLRIYSESK